MTIEALKQSQIELREVPVRKKRSICTVTMSNGLTLELTYNAGSTYGVWLLGERLVTWVVAGAA